MPKNLLFLSILASILASMLVIPLTRVAGEPSEDKAALLAFAAATHRSHYKLNWSPNTTICSQWRGITCNADNSRVVAVRLPGVGLAGAIPENTIGRLSALRTLSLRLNELSGGFPDELKRIGSLVVLHLEGNAFSGPLPDDLSMWSKLKVV